MFAPDYYKEYLEHECCNALRQIDRDLAPGWWGSRLRETFPDGTVFEFDDNALRMQAGVDEMGHWIHHNSGSKLRYMGHWPLLYLNYRNVPAYQQFYSWMEKKLFEFAPSDYAYKVWRKVNEHSPNPISNVKDAILHWAKNTKEGYRLLNEITLKRYRQFPYLKVSFFIVGHWRSDVEENTRMCLNFRFIYNNDYRWGQSTIYRNSERIDCDFAKVYKIFNFIPKDLEWLLEQIKSIPEQVRTTPNSFVVKNSEQFISPHYND